MVRHSACPVCTSPITLMNESAPSAQGQVVLCTRCLCVLVVLPTFALREATTNEKRSFCPHTRANIRGLRRHLARVRRIYGVARA